MKSLRLTQEMIVAIEWHDFNDETATQMMRDRFSEELEEAQFKFKSTEIVEYMKDVLAHFDRRRVSFRHVKDLGVDAFVKAENQAVDFWKQGLKPAVEVFGRDLSLLEREFTSR